MIRSNGDLLRSGDFCIGGIPPIYVKLPGEDAVVLEVILQLRPSGSHYDVRCSARRQLFAVYIRVVQEIYAVNDDTLFGGRLALEHLRALHDTCMLLNHVVARAGRNIISIGPDCRTRVIREERPEKFIAIVASERV